MRPFPFGARPARRHQGSYWTLGDMPRALLSVSDKTGITEFARSLAARGFEARLDRRHRACAVGGGARRHRRLHADRLSGDDGRPRQDAASGDSRRHPRAPRPRRRSGGPPRARHRPRRSRRRQPVSVCRRRGQSRHAVRRAGRGNRHRRAVARARGRQELPRRARRPSIRRTTRACSRRSTTRPASPSGSISRARPSPTPPPTTPRSPRRWRPIRLNGATFERAGRGRHGPVRRASGPVAREDPRPALRRKSAPARRLVFGRMSAAGAPQRPASAGRRSCRARSCRTPTCSTSTPRRGWSSSSTSPRPSS